MLKCCHSNRITGVARRVNDVTNFHDLFGLSMEFIRTRPCLSFVLLVVLTPYLILLPLLAAGVDQQYLKPLKLPLAFTPLIYASFVSWCVDVENGLAKLFAKLWTSKTNFAWYLAAIAVFVVVGFAALAIRFAVDGFFPPRSDFASLNTIAALSLPLLLFPGFTEEFAWRGLLQSGLQSRCNWWIASFLVGIVWGTWHGFDFLLGNWTLTWTSFWGYPPFIISNAVIIGWVYKNGRQSVFLAMLAHFSSNCVNFFMPVFEEYNGSALPAILYIGGLCLLSLILPVFDMSMIVRRSDPKERRSHE